MTIKRKGPYGYARESHVSDHGPVDDLAEAPVEDLAVALRDALGCSLDDARRSLAGLGQERLDYLDGGPPSETYW